MPKLPNLDELKKWAEVHEDNFVPTKFSPFEQSIIDKYKLAAETMILQGNAYEALAQFKYFSRSMIDVHFPPFIQHENTFQRYGDVWLIKYKNKSSFLNDDEKTRYIPHLLNKPDESILVTELQDVVKGKIQDLTPEEIETGNDALAKEIVNFVDIPLPDLDMEDKKALQELAYKMYEIGGHRWDKTKKIFSQTYSTAIIELPPNKLYFKHYEKLDSDTEKVRKAVSNQINKALKDIKKALPELYMHLTKNKDTIKRGHSCKYNTIFDEKIDWFIKF